MKGTAFRPSKLSRIIPALAAEGLSCNLIRVSRTLLCAVRLDVMLGSFFGVMRRVHVVTMRQMGMMRCRLVIAVLVMLGSFPVMVGRMLMVLGGLRVMMRSFLRHE